MIVTLIHRLLDYLPKVPFPGHYTNRTCCLSELAEPEYKELWSETSTGICSNLTRFLFLPRTVKKSTKNTRKTQCIQQLTITEQVVGFS